MTNPRLLKKRVNSIKNIGKITKALEMVSASKVKKAQEKALNSKAFALKIYELVSSLGDAEKSKTLPLLRTSAIAGRSLYVLVSTNRGLAGSLNTNLFNVLAKHLGTQAGTKHNFVTLGKKGRVFAVNYGNLVADFSDYTPFESAAVPIVKLITETFVKKEVDAIYIVFNNFITALTQDPTIKKLLPLTKDLLQTQLGFPELADKKAGVEKLSPGPRYNFEPSPEEVLQELLPYYLEIQISESLFEAEASEHSARMIAMKNASNSARDLTESLSLEYNKARQNAITSEISDIITAAAALK